MTWGPQETQKTVYEILTTDTALQTLLGGSVGNLKVYDFVPDNQIFPFIVISDPASTDRGNHSWEGLSVDLTINVWYRAPGRGRLKVQEIQKRIDELLHNTEPCIDGWNIVVLRRASVNIVTEEDNVTLHGIQKFKLFIGEA